MYTVACSMTGDDLYSRHSPCPWLSARSRLRNTAEAVRLELPEEEDEETSNRMEDGI